MIRRSQVRALRWSSLVGGLSPIHFCLFLCFHRGLLLRGRQIGVPSPARHRTSTTPDGRCACPHSSPCCRTRRPQAGCPPFFCFLAGYSLCATRMRLAAFPSTCTHSHPLCSLLVMPPPSPPAAAPPPLPPLPPAEVTRIIGGALAAEYWRLATTPGYCPTPLAWAAAAGLVRDGSEAALGRLGRDPAGVAVYWAFKREVCRMGLRERARRASGGRALLSRSLSLRLGPLSLLPRPRSPPHSTLSPSPPPPPSLPRSQPRSFPCSSSPLPVGRRLPVDGGLRQDHHPVSRGRRGRGCVWGCARVVVAGAPPSHQAAPPLTSSHLHLPPLSLISDGRKQAGDPPPLPADGSPRIIFRPNVSARVVGVRVRGTRAGVAPPLPTLSHPLSHSLSLFSHLSGLSVQFRGGRGTPQRVGQPPPGGR